MDVSATNSSNVLNTLRNTASQPTTTAAATPQTSSAAATQGDRSLQNSNTPPVAQTGQSQQPTLNLQGQQVGKLINVTA